MSIRKQTTEEFKQKIFEKYNGKVEITGEYLGGTEPISFIYHCEKHGDVINSINAKNISSNKTFQPCDKCASENKSKNNGFHRSSEDLYSEFKNFIESKGGKLFEDKWIKSKYKYTIKCEDPNHPPFKMTHDAIMNTKNSWCPWCYGRDGNFEDEIKDIILSKNGRLLSEYIGSDKHVKVECLEHNHIWNIMPLNLRKERWCYVCKMNISEKAVWDYFKVNNYNFDIQFCFDGLSTNNQELRFDFVVFNENGNIKYLLEVDDSEHWGNHKSERRLKGKERDSLKDEYCKNNSINLFRMIYNDRDDRFKNYDFYYKYLTEQIKNFELTL